MLSFIALAVCLLTSLMCYIMSLCYISHGDVNKAIYYVLTAILFNLVATMNKKN